MIGQKDSNRTKHDEIMVALKYLSTFTRTIDMPLISCEVTITLTLFVIIFYISWYCCKSITNFCEYQSKSGCNYQLKIM